MTLYRTGDPTVGVAFWTPNPEYARKVYVLGAMHSAELLPTARIKHLPAGTKLTRELIEQERDGGEHDVLVRRVDDESYEYVVMNAQVLRILS